MRKTLRPEEMANSIQLVDKLLLECQQHSTDDSVSENHRATWRKRRNIVRQFKQLLESSIADMSANNVSVVDAIVLNERLNDVLKSRGISKPEMTKFQGHNVGVVSAAHIAIHRMLHSRFDSKVECK